MNLVSAEYTVEYEVREGIFEEDGTYNKTDRPVNGANVLAYNCTVDNCSEVEDEPFYNASNEDPTTVVYPTNLNEDGYAFYLYKDGYIGWHQYNMNYSGDGKEKDGEPIYLSRKRKGSAPLVNFSTYNKVEKHKPIEINVTVGVDGDIVSALEDSRYFDAELREDVETLVELEIENESGDIIHEDNKTLNIDYSDSESFNFTYEGFNDTGDYDVSVYTTVTDDKIIDSDVNKGSFEVMVIEDNKTNYSYSLLNEASYNPTKPRKGDEVEISLEHLSNYVDEYGNLNPSNTSLSIDVKKDSEDYYSNSYILPSESTEEYSEFSTNMRVNDTGNYTIRMVASPDPEKGNSTVGENVTLSFYVYEYPDREDPVLDIISPRNKTYMDKEQLINISAEDNKAIDSIWYEWNESNYTYSTPHYFNFSSGKNKLVAWTNDTSGNLDREEVIFTIDRDFTDTQAPEISLISPEDGYETEDSKNTFSANFSDDFDLKNATLLIWDSSGDLVVEEKSSISGFEDNLELEANLDDEGEYEWNYLTFDNAGNSNYSRNNFTIIYDKKDKNRHIVYPDGLNETEEREDDKEDIDDERDRDNIISFDKEEDSRESSSIFLWIIILLILNIFLVLIMIYYYL